MNGVVRLARGFASITNAEAQNQAIRASRSDWVLTLNPDVLLLPRFIRTLVDAGLADPVGRHGVRQTLSIGPGFRPLDEQRLDSTGIFFTPAMRHFDRGWHEPDGPDFDSMEYVFGASAAAALYRRRNDRRRSVDGSFFDPAFFAYREDADVAWRAILQGRAHLTIPRRSPTMCAAWSPEIAARSPR